MYRGVDRRRRSPQLTSTYSVPQLLLAGNLVAAVALGLPLIAAYVGKRELPPELLTGTLVLSSCLFACTGILCLVGWRLVGYARSAYIGGFFAFFGILTAPLPLVGHLLPDAGQPGLSAPLARAAVAIGAISLAARAGLRPDVDSRVNPVRLLAQAGGITAACYTVLLLILHAVGTGGRQAMFRGTLTALALTWIALGGWFVALAVRGRQGMWSGCAILLMAGQAVLRVLSVDSPGTWMFPAGTLLLMAAGAALAGAGKGLVGVLGHQDRHLLRLSVDLRASEGPDEPGSRIAVKSSCMTCGPHSPQSAARTAPCIKLRRAARRAHEGNPRPRADQGTRPARRTRGSDRQQSDCVDFRLPELLAPLVATQSLLRAAKSSCTPGNLAVRGRPVDRRRQ